MARLFDAYVTRKIGDITREYERRQLIGFPVTLEGNEETLQVARDVDRTNWLTIYGICLEGIAEETAAHEADPDYEPNPFAIFLQTTSNRRYFMTFSQAAEIIRGLRAWGIASWANWNRLKDLARAADRREQLNLIDLSEGWP